MSILKVARMGHPVLRQKARPIEKHELKNAALQQFIDDMIETMREYSGVGLAAPQVHESVRLFVAGVEGSGDDLKILPFVNPVITPVGTETVEDWEGCLSIPDLRGRVPRAREVVIRALDRRGKPFEMPLKNFPARVVQHETDHLDGVLFLERMQAFDSLSFLDEFQRYHSRD